MLETGQRLRFVHGERGFWARGADVGDAQARQGRLGLGRVLGLLRGAQGGDLLVDGGELIGAAGRKLGGELCRLGVVGGLGRGFLAARGHQLYERVVVGLEHQLAQQFSK